MKKVTNFANKIKELREDKGYSIKSLANKMGVNYTYFSKIENSKSIPSEEFIEKIAVLFQYDPDELKMLAGKIPEDVKKIIADNPREAIEYLRKTFGEKK